MERLKVYTPITSVDLSLYGDKVFRINQDNLDKMFLSDLKGHYKGDIRRACGDYRVALSKRQCLSISEDAPVFAIYGKYANTNTKLWQLPDGLRNQVTKMLTPIFLVFLEI